MDRRNFLKNAALGAGLMASGSALFVPSIAKADGPEVGRKLLKLQDRDNPNIMEKKHVPLIEAPGKVKPGEWFDVTVKVGYLTEHPSTPDHWITAVELWADDKMLGVMESKAGGITSPNAEFTIRLEGPATLVAVENCNLHGTWIGDPVKVETV